MAENSFVLQITSLIATSAAHESTVRYRSANRCLVRQFFAESTCNLTEEEFPRAFRMRRSRLSSIVQSLTPYLKLDERMASSSSSNSIVVAMQVGNFFQCMAGDQYSDCMMLFGVFLPAVFRCIREVSFELKMLVPLPGLPRTAAGRRFASAGFTVNRFVANLLKGSVGAIDRIFIKICKPTEVLTLLSSTTERYIKSFRSKLSWTIGNTLLT